MMTELNLTPWENKSDVKNRPAAETPKNAGRRVNPDLTY